MTRVHALGLVLVSLLGGACNGKSSSGSGDLATSADLADLSGAVDDLLAPPDLGKKILPDLSPVITDGEPAGIYGITYAHNQARANATPTPTPALDALTWSMPVATAAQTWANGCNYLHSGNGYGENLYASAGDVPTGASIVKSWTDEQAMYDYAANTCSGACGRYLQVVARASLHVGCGIAICNANSPFSGFSQWTFVVCDYDPPGGGARPY